MTQFLKFHEWKQQSKPQFEWLISEKVPNAVMRLCDGEIFIRGELTSVGNYNYKIFKFAPDKINVVLIIQPHGHMRIVAPINNLSKYTQNDPVPEV